ncbi:hypothetical protein JCGZ_24180 [Jatropha curcas]|uniref:mitogen-activated protein kinase n=1 Tax=Jatropha curcas TaxID=180498 RepID=A0A067JP50_JATCU|nr:hypothetical protein JCGZ_24180 [Jatropha curcas]
MSMESSSGSSEDNITGIPTHGGRYVQYDVYGILFEVSRKYVPPIRFLGSGAYGTVCAAKNSETQEEVAIKKIVNAFDNQKVAKRTLREIKLLQHMNHENISYDLPRRRTSMMFTFVYELMDTDLQRAIHSKPPLTDADCQRFLYQLLRGLKYIHSADVLHRDLKPGNLLVNGNDLKIADFGFARTTSKTDPMTDYVVTRWYRAPELLNRQSRYTEAIDIWSVGCILGEIMTRQPLFPAKTSTRMLKLIKKVIGLQDDNGSRPDFATRFRNMFPYAPNMSEDALRLLERMLVYDPNQRITVNEALKHPYLAHYHDVKNEPDCPSPFDFDFDESSLSEDEIRELIWVESEQFNPYP